MKLDKEVLEEVAMALDHATRELSRFVLNNQLEAYFSASEKLNEVIEELAQQASEPAQVSQPVALRVIDGEICYKSKADDQCFNMWCPVGYYHGYKDGTKFFTSPPDYEALVAEREKLQTRVAELEGIAIRTDAAITEATENVIQIIAERDKLQTSLAEYKSSAEQGERILTKFHQDKERLRRKLFEAETDRDNALLERDKLQKDAARWDYVMQTTTAIHDAGQVLSCTPEEYKSAVDLAMEQAK